MSGRFLAPGVKPVKPSKLSVSAAIPKTFVPPVLHEVGKLAASVASVSTTDLTIPTGGSATGNPRNKCALQPGHSLMDWIRLGSSGKDLTGVGAAAGNLPVTLEELQKHGREGDAWTAIRGNVYNITEYLSFHPGGVDTIMQGAGKDATELFEEIHPWVNFTSILAKCRVGPLVQSPKHRESAVFRTSKSGLGGGSLPANYVSKENAEKIKTDWIQKIDSVTLNFYTGSLSNPYIEVMPPVHDSLHVIITMPQMVHDFVFQLSQEVRWPPQLYVNYDTGRVDVIFEKVIKQIWTHIGTTKTTVKQLKHGSQSPILKGYTLLHRKKLTHNCYFLELARADGTVHNSPLGKHVKVFNSNEESRSYTTVPNIIGRNFSTKAMQTQNLCLLIKSYPRGAVSSYVCSRSEEDYIASTNPIGLFDLKTIAKKTVFIFLVGGTGITPVMNLSLFMLQRRSVPCDKVLILFFNSHEEDMFLKKELKSLESEDRRFTIEFILTQPKNGWKGLKGRVSEEMLLMELSKLPQRSMSEKFFAICGPKGFMESCNEILQTKMKVSAEDIYTFQG